MNTDDTVSKQIYLGLFMVTLATLMYEILLPRIFSVTLWYHFAFVAVSIAMLGLTAGAMCVYLFPYYFATEHVRYRLALCSLLFSLSTVLSLLVYLLVPYYIIF